MADTLVDGGFYRRDRLRTFLLFAENLVFPLVLKSLSYFKKCRFDGITHRGDNIYFVFWGVLCGNVFCGQLGGGGSFTDR